MTIALPTQSALTFEAFLDYDDGTENLYELINGEPILMPEPSLLHQSIVGYLESVFRRQIEQLGHNWEPFRNTVIRVPGRLLADGRRPDLAIVDKLSPAEIEADVKGIRTTPHMIIEVASSNWANDLRDKISGYIHLGVPEYWVLDYKGQIPAKYCDRGKGVKTIVFTFRESGGYGYDKAEFIEDEIIACRTFPNLQLTTTQILDRTLP